MECLRIISAEIRTGSLPDVTVSTNFLGFTDVDCVDVAFLEIAVFREFPANERDVWGLHIKQC